MYWRRLIPVCRHPPAEGYNLLSFTSLSWKKATPPALVYQPFLEGSYYPLLSFTSYHWKGATTPLLKASTLSTTADHVSSIFKLDQTASIQPFTYQKSYFAHCLQHNSETTITRISEITRTSE